MPEKRVVLLPGDGVGPDVAAEARLVLELVAPDVALEEHLIGAAAIRATGDPLPAESLAACRAADAVLKGPVGDPEFDAADVRPEQGLLRLRAALDAYANLRPAISADVDMLIVRELVGGLYFGASGVRDDGTVFDTCEYHPDQVERVVRRAFALAQRRRGFLTSVDKANVLETSRMWRRVVDTLAPEFPDVRVEHMLVDNAAMQLATSPREVRRHRHREHVRRHPQRPRRRDDGRPRACPVREPLRRRAGDLRAGARLRAGHRRHRRREPDGDAALDGAPARARPRTARARRRRSPARSSTRSSPHRRPISAAPPPPPRSGRR